MTAPLQAAYTYCGQTLRERARDEWLASLFAPTQARPHLHALHLLAHELATLRDKTAQPMAGEIRLQYWRDVLGGLNHGDTAGNPLAAAVLDTIAVCKLPLAPFLALIDAHLFDVYDDPMPDVATLEGYCGETTAAILRLACLVLGQGADPGGAQAAGHAGVAVGITRLLCELPRTSARGQVFLPLDILTKHGLSAASILQRQPSPSLAAALAEMRTMARAHARKARAQPLPNRDIIASAFLQLPIAELYLQAMEQPGYQPFITPVQVPQWRRQWAMWRA